MRADSLSLPVPEGSDEIPQRTAAPTIEGDLSVVWKGVVIGLPWAVPRIDSKDEDQHGDVHLFDEILILKIWQRKKRNTKN